MIPQQTRKVLALIPARGGSKGVINKNLRVLNGSPLIDYTIRAALQSKNIDDVYVSSDSEAILEYAGRHQCHCIKRPSKFAQDCSPASDVVSHFITTLSTKIKELDPLIVYLQPTSPLRDVNDIDNALMLLNKTLGNRLISVVEMHHSPYKAFQLCQSGELQSLFDESFTNKRRQDLPRLMLPNGAIYTFLLSEFVNHKGFPSNGSIPYIMEAEASIDIDNEDDFNLVEKILEDSK
jgi:CMP-N-acetylneuraminic acid synthetase